MDFFRSTATNCQKDSAWEKIESHVKEERSIEPIRKIVVNGAVDVVFRCCDKPMLLVAGETAEAVASVKTYFKGEKLVIEREAMSISMVAGRNIVFHNSVGGSFVVGNIVNSKPSSTYVNQGKVIVGVALPEAPDVKVKGSGDVTLHDLMQTNLVLSIEGSGNITACGQVEQLEVDIAGSGDVGASDLIADRATLSIAGSGDIEAFVRSDVRASVAGSGDIVVRGNPPNRDHRVLGSGKIKFK